MKTLSILFALLFSITFSSQAQKFLTKSGHIWFSSSSEEELIEAHNHSVNAALDSKTGDFVFKVLMKSFEFEKALMQEHFNENYVESDKYPTAIFKGKILDIEKIDFNNNGKHQVRVKGQMTLHGVTQTIEQSGTLIIKDGKLQALSTFTIKLADYKIKIPKAVVKKIAEEIKIQVDVKLLPFKSKK